MLGDLIAALPLGIVAVMGCFVLLLDTFNEGDSRFLGWISALGFAAAIATCYLLWDREMTSFSTDTFGLMMVMGKFEVVTCALLAFIGLVVALLSVDYAEEHQFSHGEYYALLNFAVFGMMVLATAINLVTVFVGLEVMSIAIYILAAIKRSSAFSAEAGLKYFILGAFASGFMVYGMAFLYGETVSLDYIGIVAALNGTEPSGYLGLALVLLTVAFGFKIALVPFHQWTPDVYEGAPTTVVSLMATGVKTAAVIAMARFFVMAVPASMIGAMSDSVFQGLWLLAALTMTIGNLIAIQQRSIKRMLGYSSVAHAGYLLVGILAAHSAGNPSSPVWGVGMGSILFYLFTYALANLAAFGVVSLFEREASDHVTLDNIGGLAKQHGIAAVVLAIGMFSLAGVPPTGGFFGKLVLFRDALAVDFDKFLWLVIIAVMNSVVSVYYYLRVIVYAFMKDAEGDFRISLRASALAALVIAALGSLQVGMFPGRWVDASNQAAAEIAQQSPATDGEVVATATPTK